MKLKDAILKRQEEIAATAKKQQKQLEYARELFTEWFNETVDIELPESATIVVTGYPKREAFHAVIHFEIDKDCNSNVTVHPEFHIELGQIRFSLVDLDRDLGKVEWQVFDPYFVRVCDSFIDAVMCLFQIDPDTKPPFWIEPKKDEKWRERNLLP